MTTITTFTEKSWSLIDRFTFVNCGGAKAGTKISKMREQTGQFYTERVVEKDDLKLDWTYHERIV